MPIAPKPTLYAQRGLEFVALFQVRFVSFDVSGHKPRLRPPPGVSTSGGKLATQHIVLEPADPSAPTSTVGSVNVATMNAKVRTYDCVRAVFRARFKDRPFPLDRDQYQAFMDAVTTLMKERELAIEIETTPPELALPADDHEGGRQSLAPQGGVSLVGVIVVSLALALVAAAVVFIALRTLAHP